MEPLDEGLRIGTAVGMDADEIDLFAIIGTYVIPSGDESGIFAVHE